MDLSVDINLFKIASSKVFFFLSMVESLKLERIARCGTTCLGRQTSGSHEFEASLVYIASSRPVRTTK